MKGIALWNHRLWVTIFFFTTTGYLLFFSPVSFASAGEAAQAEDETMLMFVGEELSVVTVASRRPESPLAAPAIVSVVSSSDIEARGFQTLAELLAREPGFYMARRARGTVPYLRGISDGVLFLYDGVQVTTDVTKDFHPLDRELSLNSVKRVEIVRGPGSVLWGPDAYAGIVNVVPFTGRDRPGFETKAFGGTDDLYGGYVGWGHSANQWDAFLSGYGAKERYYDDHFLVGSIGPGGAENLGQEQIDPSYYLELNGNAHFGDWFSLSGRYSDFKRRYTLHDVTDLSWAGERESPFSFIKANIAKAVGQSHLSLTGYYEYVNYQVTDVDLKRDQKNHIYFGELLWDRRLLQKGLLTAGVSYRRNEVDGAVVEDGFLPDFLVPENNLFVPSVAQNDYTNNLKSLFAQYRHRFDAFDVWFGGRIDDNSQYDTTLSHSLGVNWRVNEDWRVKATYGTAYRSPYSAQLFGGESFDPEKISTVSLQAAWDPSTDRALSATVFYSKLTDHVSEDPYGGISKPADQDIIGLELAGKARLLKHLDLFGNLTALDNWGGSEEYEFLDRVFIRPDGTRVEVYDKWKQSYDEGPDLIANLGFIWQLHPKITLAVDGGITSKVPYAYARDTVSGHYNQDLLLDATLRVKDVMLKGATLTLRGTNLLDQDYTVPGLYGPVEGPPFEFYVEWALRF